MKRSFFLLITCFLASVSFVKDASAQTPVYVAAYDYPPYFSTGLETDVTRELIQILNDYQDTYDFQLQVIPPNARYQALSKDGCCDVIFFESEEWGWKGKAVDATIPIIRGRERFIAKRIPGRTQAFFSSLHDKTVGAVKGYHYNFDGNERTADELGSSYRAYLSHSALTNLRMLMGGRIDIMPINDELLSALQNAGDQYEKDLLVSDQIFDDYMLSMIVGHNKRLTRETMQQLVRELARQGHIDKLLQRFNLSRFQVYRIGLRR